MELTGSGARAPAPTVAVRKRLVVLENDRAAEQGLELFADAEAAIPDGAPLSLKAYIILARA